MWSHFSNEIKFAGKTFVQKKEIVINSCGNAICIPQHKNTK